LKKPRPNSLGSKIKTPAINFHREWNMAYFFQPEDSEVWTVCIDFEGID
jgi:hypothetical protein